MTAAMMNRFLTRMYGTGNDVRANGNITIENNGHTMTMAVTDGRNVAEVQFSLQEALDLVELIGKHVDNMIDSKIRIKKSIKVFHEPDSQN